MALLMATRRAAGAASTNSLIRIFSRKPHLSSVVAPSTSCFIRYFSDDKDFTAASYGSYCKRSHKFSTNPGISDPRMQKPFHTLGPKGTYEFKQVEEGLLLRMEMPVINKDDVKVLVEYKDILDIKGEKTKESTFEQNGRAYNFRVKIPPHVFISDQTMEVEIKNGVLRMMIPNTTTRTVEARMKNGEVEIPYKPMTSQETHKLENEETKKNGTATPDQDHSLVEKLGILTLILVPASLALVSIRITIAAISRILFPD